MDFIAILQNFGVAVFSLICLSYAVWRSLIWVAEKLAKPLIEAHVAFLNIMQQAIVRHEEVLNQISAMEKEQLLLTRSIVEHLKK